MPLHKRSGLWEAARSFCDAFAARRPLDEILSHFSSDDDVIAFEHGLPELAPFCGRVFKGHGGIKEYFTTISTYISYRDMVFGNYVVDAAAGKVNVTGSAKFTWVSTGQEWSEIFTYVLEFDETERVKKYEIWADSGAAYLASKGLLKDGC